MYVMYSIYTYICSKPEQYKSTPKYQTDQISQASQSAGCYAMLTPCLPEHQAQHQTRILVWSPANSTNIQQVKYLSLHFLQYKQGRYL